MLCSLPVIFNHLIRVYSAETNANAHGIIQGSLDTELSSMGYLQSRALARYLQDHHFSHIYSSDLKRASEVCTHQSNQLLHLVNISDCSTNSSIQSCFIDKHSIRSSVT